MAALLLNGIALPVALDQISRLEPMLIGEEARAFSGADLTSVRGWKEGWKAKLTPQAAATAAALRGLVKGDGFSWSFDTDLYADLKGLGAASGSGLFVAGKYGNALSTYQTMTFAVGASSAWTIAGWVFKSSLGIWHHYIRLSSGAKYKDGASTAEDPLMDVSGANLVLSPAVTLGGAVAWAPSTVYAIGDKVLESGVVWVQETGTNGTNTVEPTWSTALGAEVEEDGGGGFGGPWIWRGSNTGYDDLRFLPFVVPSTWPAQMYAEASARAHPALHRLRLAGDATAGLNAGYATVVGKLVGDPKLRRCVIDGSDVTNAEELELELREA
jgi:hypothetical protein